MTWWGYACWQSPGLDLYVGEGTNGPIFLGAK